MSKPGRPRKFAGKMIATAGIRVPEDLLNAIYVAALRRNTDVSTLTREYWQRVVARDGVLFNKNRQPDEKDALLTT